MKLYTKLKKTEILLVAFLALSTLSTEVFADKIKRSCTASYQAMITSIDYSYNKDTREMDKSLTIPSDTLGASFNTKYDFKAHGGCGKLVPNRCRKRARDALLPCAKAHVKSPNKMPKECRSDSIENYPIKNLKSVLKERVCKTLKTRDGITVTTFPKPYQVNLVLGVKILGNNGCGKKGLGKTTVVNGDTYPITGNSDFFRLPLKKVKVTCD